MNIANQVKSLAEDIEASYGTRIAVVSDIVRETHQILGSFHRAHQKMADELRDSLSTFERERMKDFAILIGDVRAAVEAIEKDTAETRAENVKDLKEMANKLAEFLSSSEKGRLEEFADFMNGVKGAVGAISRDTAQMRANHAKELKEMAEKLTDFLSSSEKDRKEEFASLIGEIKARVAGIEKNTVNLLSGFAQDQREARTHWQNLAKIMAAKRAGKSIPSPKAEMGVPTMVKEEAEEAFAGGELKDRVLRVIQTHPSGIKLTEIGKILQVAYIQAAKPIKDLLAEVKITKRDSKYLPA